VGTNELHERLTQVFRDVFADDALMLEPDTSASQVPGWDSLAHLRLMLTIEKTFRVKFTATEIGQLKNVGDLEKLLASKS
jgi:acyl carrier protein